MIALVGGLAFIYIALQAIRSTKEFADLSVRSEIALDFDYLKQLASDFQSMAKELEETMNVSQNKDEQKGETNEGN